jgi:hypothetical protein
VDGQDVAPVDGKGRLPLLRDGGQHHVHITLGSDGANGATR